MHYLEYVTKGHSQVIRYLYVAGTCMYLTALLDGIASFSCRSLLLGTSAPNDIYIYVRIILLYT